MLVLQRAGYHLSVPHSTGGTLGSACMDLEQVLMFWTKHQVPSWHWTSTETLHLEVAQISTIDNTVSITIVLTFELTPAQWLHHFTVSYWKPWWAWAVECGALVKPATPSLIQQVHSEEKPDTTWAMTIN